MTMIVGIDGGNNEVKIFGDAGEMKFSSALGEFRERKLTDSFSKDDMIFEYRGKKGFAGTLAQFESEFSASMLGDSKAHEELLIRVLLALHRYTDEETDFMIVVGQPIGKHTEKEKQKMKNMLEGVHDFTLNDVRKVINIQSVAVAAEGGSAFWSNPKKGKIRLIDFGSGTVNAATLIDGRYVDRDSFTLKQGLNTITSSDFSSFARAVSVQALKKWDNDDDVFLVGGGADTMLNHVIEYFPQAQLLKPKVETLADSGIKINGNLQAKSYNFLSPIFANAVGFYNIGKKVFKVEQQV
jgi:plasmid segregation protein ParM